MDTLGGIFITTVEINVTEGGMDMCYVCGRSSNKIVHSMSCRYVKLIPEKNRKFFSNLKEASEAGYVQCKYCAHIVKYLRKEEKELEKFCRSNGIYYRFNSEDGSLDVISPSGKWKIIVNGQKHFIWLYHKNNHGTNPGDPVPGYHSQKIRCSSLIGYMNYILKHDWYREENPLYESQRHHNLVKGSKRWKKEQRKADRIRKTQSIRYVMNLLDELSVGRVTC